MDWNAIMPFIGFGGIVVICSLCFKAGRFVETVELLNKRVFANEKKSINATNEQGDQIGELKNLMLNMQAQAQVNQKSIESNQKDMANKLDGISNKLDQHERRISTLEACK